MLNPIEILQKAGCFDIKYRKDFLNQLYVMKMKKLSDKNTAQTLEQKNRENQKTVERAVNQITAVLADLTLSCDLSYKQLIHNYKQQLIKEDRKKRPKSSVVDIAARTNIDRRFITDTLNGNSISPKLPKVTMIFEEVRKVCDQQKTRLIHKTEGTESFELICRRFASGSLTPKAVFKELFRQGKLRDHGEFYELMKPKHAAQRLKKAAKQISKMSKKLSS